MNFLPKFSFNFFKRKPTGEDSKVDYTSVGLAPPAIEPIGRPAPTQFGATGAMTTEFATQENIKAKVDLIMTQIDNMRIQHESMNERMVRIEGMLKQLIEMAKTTRF